jgi:hypothetical protein
MWPAMFEKDQDYTRVNRTPVSVSVTMTSGEVMRGYLNVPKTRSLMEELNRNEPFVEFDPYGGERMFIARTSIAAVRSLEVPTVQPLASTAKLKDFDPFTILGVSLDASATEIRSAYVTLAKRYHPDRFAQIELPPEVASYMSSMLLRINIAYRELKGTLGVEAEAA